MAIGDLNDLLDVDLPDDDWDTVGGLIFNVLERIPSEGEAIETHGFRFTVIEMDGRRVKRVMVAPLESARSEAGADDERAESARRD